MSSEVDPQANRIAMIDMTPAEPVRITYLTLLVVRRSRMEETDGAWGEGTINVAFLWSEVPDVWFGMLVIRWIVTVDDITPVDVG